MKKFAGIFLAADIHSVTVIVMEVPCCSAMPSIVKKGMLEAGKNIPIEQVVVSLRGEIIKRL